MTAWRMKSWDEVSARKGRNDLPWLAAEHWDDLPPEDQVTAVHEAWVSAEWPERLLDTEMWVVLFDDAGYQSDGEVCDREENLPERVRLYRGARYDRLLGMSWTRDRARAEWFADRFEDTFGATYVVEIEIPRTYVLAEFSGRGEDEVVVDTMDMEEDEILVKELRQGVADGEREASDE